MVEKRNKLIVYDAATIRSKIYTIRSVQVMLDSDLAELYGVETKRLNEQVKRNIDRFPSEFCFQLSKEELENLRSHFATSSWGGRRYYPYAFTEQGVAMLSAVLKSPTAVRVSVQIIKAFVQMRRFLFSNASVFTRLDNIEQKQFQFEIETKENFNKIFNALQSRNFEPKQGIFFNGQIFDAYKFVAELVRKANKSITLIDNYIDETVLSLFTKKKKTVKVIIFTKKITKSMRLDAEKFNAQYPSVELKKFTKAHDRFLIIDDKDVYHFGASLKDLGKKWFAFSKLDKSALSLMENLKNVKNDE